MMNMKKRKIGVEKMIEGINIENEIEFKFDFDYEDVIEKAIKFTAEYVNFPYEYEVNVLIVNNDEIKKINLDMRGIDAPTDVLSFPMLEYDEAGKFDSIDEENDALWNLESERIILGDIVLSVDKIFAQAKEYGHTPIREMSFLVVHSMLHLFGYDHINEEDKTMEKLQETILNEMGIRRE